jgi:hypothetical protein
MDEDSPAGLPGRRVSALREGAVRYFTGKPCSQGHIAPRYSANGHCVVCTRRQVAAWQKQQTGPCGIEGCDRLAVARGWCHAHFERWRKTGDVRADVPIEARAPRVGPKVKCGVEGCDKGGKLARGMCAMHYTRWRKHGDPLFIPEAAPAERDPAARAECRADGCDKEPATRGFCLAHYAKLQRYGDVEWHRPVLPNDQVNYHMLHTRLRQARGSARVHLCVGECGRQARQWAWLHGEDPCDFRNYVPMCCSCHQRYDRSPDPGIQPWGIGPTPRRRRRAGGPPLPVLPSAAP